jgi:hypothetical protein
MSYLKDLGGGNDIPSTYKLRRFNGAGNAAPTVTNKDRFSPVMGLINDSQANGAASLRNHSLKVPVSNGNAPKPAAVATYPSPSPVVNEQWAPAVNSKVAPSANDIPLEFQCMNSVRVAKGMGLQSTHGLIS